MEILHIENTFSVIIHKIFTNVEKSSARNSRRSSRGFGFALVNLRITNWVPSSPIPHKYSNTSCVDTCESIGRSTSPCGYMTNADKCRQMSTNVHKCPGVSKPPGRTKRSSKCLGQMSAVIGQDYQFWVATAMINDWNHRLVLKTSDMWTTGQETWHRTHPNAQDKSVAPVSAILTMKRCSTSSSWRAAAGQDGGQVRKATMHLNKLSRYVMLWTLVTIPIVFICIGDWLILQMHLG